MLASSGSWGESAKIQVFAHHRPSGAMTYVVTESCIRCKYTDCVDVCPVDCFREGPNFLVIDPDECIDCTLCVAECPVEAIFAEDDVPADQADFTALNAELSKVWKPLVERKPPPPGASARPAAPWWRASSTRMPIRRRARSSRASRCCPRRAAMARRGKASSTSTAP